MTITLDWPELGALAVFLVAVAIWLFRSRRSPGGHDLSGPPKHMTMPKPGSMPQGPASGLAPMPTATPPSEGLTPARLEAIRGALATDNKIMAIKLYREATGTSLLDAKNAVEAMLR